VGSFPNGARESTFVSTAAKSSGDYIDGFRFLRLAVVLGRDRPELENRTEPDVGKLLERYEWFAEKVVADRWNEATVLP
jgi:hypothetical protein